MSKQTAANTARLGRIQRIADAYIPVSGRDTRDFATDLLSDLQHWCKAKNVRFGASLMRAQWHFTAEQVEEGRR